ncbi:MAG: zinc ribbon domain-containing protein [Candidatus Aminicenantes bacterium]|nr:zinc ribbon domain-containing protein [Candidatus Aminicenantes bacterium]
MPIYEYICQQCGNGFETLVRLGGEQSVSCAECGSPDVRKLFSSFGIGGCGSRLKAASNSCTSCTGKSCSTCR